MYAVLKVLCIVTYVLGISAVLGLLPEAWRIFGTMAGVLLAAHVLEVVFMFKHVRRYEGPLAVSVLLTLLFGLLHWKPLADRARH